MRWLIILIIGISWLDTSGQETKKIIKPRESDLNAWVGLKIDHKLTKKIDIKLSQQLRFKDNIQRLNSIFTNLAFDFDLPKKFGLVVGSRIGYLPSTNTFNRIYCDLARDFKNVKRFDFDWRIRLQQEWMQELESEALVRNKLKTNYNVRKSKFNLSFEFEIFNSLNNNPGFLQFTSYRSTFSVDRKINKRNDLSFFTALTKSVNNAPAENSFIVGAIWGLSPNLKKKKNKDK